MTDIILYAIIAMNILTFAVYGIDKLKAKHGKWRIPELTLLALAFAGGSIGAYCGMKVWRHKTKHKKFCYGVPLIIILHIALAAYILTG